MVNSNLVRCLSTRRRRGTCVTVGLTSLARSRARLRVSPTAVLNVYTKVVPFSSRGSSPEGAVRTNVAGRTLKLCMSGCTLHASAETRLLRRPRAPVIGAHVVSSAGCSLEPSNRGFIITLVSCRKCGVRSTVIVGGKTLRENLTESSFFETCSASRGGCTNNRMSGFRIPSGGVGNCESRRTCEGLSSSNIMGPRSCMGSNSMLVNGASPPEFLRRGFKDITSEEERASMAMERNRGNVISTILLSRAIRNSGLTGVEMESAERPRFNSGFTSERKRGKIVNLVLSPRSVPFARFNIIPSLVIGPRTVPSEVSVKRMLRVITNGTKYLRNREISTAPFGRALRRRVRRLLLSGKFRSTKYRSLCDKMANRELSTRVFINITCCRGLRRVAASGICTHSEKPMRILAHRPARNETHRNNLEFKRVRESYLVTRNTTLALGRELLSRSSGCRTMMYRGYNVLTMRSADGRGGCYPVYKSMRACPIRVSCTFGLLLSRLGDLYVFPGLILKSGTWLGLLGRLVRRDVCWGGSGGWF